MNDNGHLYREPGYVYEEDPWKGKTCSDCARCVDLDSIHICVQVYQKKNADFDAWLVNWDEPACEYFTEDRKEFVYGD